MNKKKMTKIVYNKIFQGAFKKGDFLKFVRGKIIWKVDYETNGGGFYLVSISPQHWNGMYIYPRDIHRVYRLEDIEVLKWVLREDPNRLQRYFGNHKNLLKMLRKIVPEPKV